MPKRVEAFDGEIMLFQYSTGGSDTSAFMQQIVGTNVTGAFHEIDEIFSLDFECNKEKIRTTFSFDPANKGTSETSNAEFTSPTLSKINENEFALFGTLEYHGNSWFCITKFKSPIHKGYPSFDSKMFDILIELSFKQLVN
jgi:hypothetical protein